MSTSEATTVGIFGEEVSAPPLLRQKTLEPCTIVIFGATGDLTKRKLVPALHNLLQEGELPENFATVGFARREKTSQEFADDLFRAISEQGGSVNETSWRRFAEGLYYVRGAFDDDAAYRSLRDELARIDQERGTRGNYVFYLATPPRAFPVILEHLQAVGLIQDPQNEDSWSRVIIEKPIGRDLESAETLNQLVGEVLDESQTYRIDHYLGKETVQNILVFRFGNAIFEPLWNRKYIDHVQITMAESIGIEGRGEFFDANGVLRDVVQNHLLQILALVAMEPPTSLSADDIRSSKVQVLRALQSLEADRVSQDLVRAQYRGYRQEEGVSDQSGTPTYVAMRMMVDNWRWQGVPFYLRAGKGLAGRATEVAIHFQSIPLCLFGAHPEQHGIDQNVLTLRIQPDEGIHLKFASKTPGEDLAVANVHMNMTYENAFGGRIATAYERLLLDSMRGDATLFARRDEVEEAWRYLAPALEAWEAPANEPIPTYEFGSDGPSEAEALLARDGRTWRPIA